MILNLARFAGVKHSFGEQVIEHGLSAKIITSILTEWPFHRLTKKRLSKHGTGGVVMESKYCPWCGAKMDKEEEQS